MYRYIITLVKHTYKHFSQNFFNNKFVHKKSILLKFIALINLKFLKVVNVSQSSDHLYFLFVVFPSSSKSTDVDTNADTDTDADSRFNYA